MTACETTQCNVTKPTLQNEPKSYRTCKNLFFYQ